MTHAYSKSTRSSEQLQLAPIGASNLRGKAMPGIPHNVQLFAFAACNATTVDLHLLLNDIGYIHKWQKAAH